jgi:hypothetical protein
MDIGWAAFKSANSSPGDANYCQRQRNHNKNLDIFFHGNLLKILKHFTAQLPT